MEVCVKKSKWLLLAGLVIMVMAVGCKKMGDPADVAAGIGDPMVLPLEDVDGTTYGHVYVWDDGSKLFVKYALDQLPDGNTYWLEKCQCDVEMDVLGFPTSAGHINPDAFGARFESGYPGITEYTLEIPLVGGWQSGVAVAAHAVVRCLEPWNQFSTWAYYPGNQLNGAGGECQGWWFPYGPGGCWQASTAWGGHALDEWYEWQFTGKNWALYLRHTLGDDPYVGDLYAGNPKKFPDEKDCGSVTVWDDVVAGVGNIYVKYDVDREGYSLYSGHTIVRGSLDDIPQVNGNPIPGHFDVYFGPFVPTVASHTVTIPYNSDWGTDLYIGAHAIVGH
jgi:hypothetical protein